MTDTAIEVTCAPDTTDAAWTCRVTVTDAAGSGEHDVRVTRADLDRYAPGAADPHDLVRRSFAFLLDREPRTSILRAFDLPVIERYFPEYRRVIGG